MSHTQIHEGPVQIPICCQVYWRHLLYTKFEINRTSMNIWRMLRNSNLEKYPDISWSDRVVIWDMPVSASTRTFTIDNSLLLKMRFNYVWTKNDRFHHHLGKNTSHMCFFFKFFFSFSKIQFLHYNYTYSIKLTLLH